jgi:putative hydrolase of the HAD superfamily
MNKAIKNIIFDFGGVIIDIDYTRAIKGFQEKGLSDFTKYFTGIEQAGIFDELDKGLIEPQQFRDYIKNLFNNKLDDEEVDYIWNLILIGIPPHRIELLKKLRNNYRIFLLSNTNAIHYQKYNADLFKDYGVEDIGCFFEKAYFSFMLGMRKPGKEIFELAMNENMLKPAETLFIDDSEPNLVAPKEMGIQTFHLKPGADIADIFQDGHLLLQ